MRINIYSQELTAEVLPITKESNTGIVYKAVQFVLHSSPMLHHPPADDDRSAVTFWLPQSERGLREFHAALANAYMLVGDAIQNLETVNGASKFDRHMMRVSEQRLASDSDAATEQK